MKLVNNVNDVDNVSSQVPPLAYYKKSGTCLETGWSAADGATLAQATTGYTEGQVTRSGVSFAHFLSSLGVQGPFELTPTPIKHKHPKPPVHRPPPPAPS